MKRFLISRFALVSIAGLVVLGGCSNPADTTANNATPGDSTAAAPKLTLAEPSQPADSVPGAPAKKPYVIGVSLLTQDDEFYRALKKGLEDQAKKQNVTVDIVSGDKDRNKQADQVTNFIAKKVDAIVLCPVDSSAIVGAVMAANTAKIPVFTADIASKCGTIVSHVASNNVEGGRLAGEYAAELLNGKGKIAILDLKTVTSVQDRVKGFKAAIAKYPGITIVADIDVPEAKREEAVTKATNLLTTQPDLNLIFGINDNVALGTLSALKQANKPDVIVIGFDAGPEAQTYISSGTSPLKADAIQFPHLIGVSTIDTVIKSLNGEKVPAIIAVPTGIVKKDSFQKA
ncbi:MAG: ribose transport system substrate-binding protein [Fimbriimonadaceae bacterium]|nr:ribose transport system substrate-binding protein [Fimbriimonadaceae bacterium]